MSARTFKPGNNLYHVRVDLALPGHQIVAGREPALHRAHEDVYVAIRDAFDAVRRRLEDHMRIHDHRAKVHEGPPRGRIARRVLAFATARPADGGAGAVYILLRR